MAESAGPWRVGSGRKLSDVGMRGSWNPNSLRDAGQVLGRAIRSCSFASTRISSSSFSLQLHLPYDLKRIAIS